MDKYGEPRILLVGRSHSGSTSGIHDQSRWCNCAGSVCNEHGPAGGLFPGYIANAVQRSPDFVNLAYFVPMDQLQLPASLDGSLFKPERDKRHCSLKANNDLEAISLWLDECQKPKTRRVYAQLIEKVLLWCVAQRGISLSQISVEDLNALYDFLADPVPHDIWLPLQNHRATSRWSPFSKAPSARTQEVILTALSSLLQSWANQAYIWENPCSKSRGPSKTARVGVVDAPLRGTREALVTVGEWAYLTHAAGSPIENATVCALINLAYFGALKVAEIAAIQLKNVRRIPSTKPGRDIWSIIVPSRKAQREEVFLTAELVTIFCLFFPVAPNDFHSFIASQPDTYLVDFLNQAPCAGHADVSEPPSVQSLSSSLKPVFRKAAQLAERCGDTATANRLEIATLSWLADALEKHLKQKGKLGSHCWCALGACKLCPATLVRYLPDRRSQSPEAIEHALYKLAAALND
ncbi:hypothetical protein [Undibacterium sp. TJN19]|uniref:hypothetical protein n=1 Tax=Undibacterium sp. TJN19 TaxID=3413055 RepID=UPI003BF3F6D6